MINNGNNEWNVLFIYEHSENVLVISVYSLWLDLQSKLFPQKYTWVMGKYARKYHVLLLAQANNCYYKTYVDYYIPFIHKLFYFMPV